MNRRKTCFLPALICALLAACSLPLFTVQGADDPWVNVTPGIDYQAFDLPGPVRAYVARMDRSAEQDTLESAIANGALASGGELVSGMAARMDESISAWNPGSGQRSRVVIAINGSGYTANATPKSGMIVEGYYAKRFDDAGGGSGFGWRTDRSAFIGRCVTNVPDQQYVGFPDRGGASIPIAGINVPRGNNQLILYTPQYGPTTATEPGEVEVVVEFREGFLLQANPGVSGVATSIRIGGGSTPIPFDAVVLSASGSARDSLLDYLTPNGRIEITQRIQHSDWDCRGENTFSWAHTYASLHGDYAILRDGEVYSKPDDAGAISQEPRTAIAFNEGFVFFIVVDGRSSLSVGMTYAELGEFARDALGATWAIAQDGGGSSVMVINGRVVNHPVSYCRPGAVAYAPDQSWANSDDDDPLFSTPTPLPTLLPGVIPQPTPEPYACERAVANAMMMVTLEDPVFSPSGLVSFDQVITAADTDVRLGPGDNFAVLGRVPVHTTGSILPHLGGLNGVLAKGAYWWQVSFGEVSGWVPETSLIYVSTPPGNLGARIDFARLPGG